MKKSIAKKGLVLCSILMFFVMLFSIPGVKAEAASQKVVQKSISSSKFTKVSKSVKNLDYIDKVEGGKMTAYVKGDVDEEYGEIDITHLFFTSNGKSAAAHDLKSIVKKKYGLNDQTYIQFYNLTYIKGCFYLTGGYAANWGDFHSSENVTPILISTKNGTDLTISKVKLTLNENYGNALNWSLYYVKGQYVAANDVMLLRTREDLSEYNYASYYVSKDLKKWTRKKLVPTFKADKKNGMVNCFEIAQATEKGLVIMESTPYWFAYEEGLALPRMQLLYTTDFSKYKKVSTLNSTFVRSGKTGGAAIESVAMLDGNAAGQSIAMVYPLETVVLGDGQLAGKSSQVCLYRSEGFNNYKKAVEFKGEWDYWRWTSDNNWKRVWLYVQGKKKNYVYITNSFTGTYKKYSTTLQASKFYDRTEKDSWIYEIYGGKYILASKDGGKTMYQIKTGLKNMTGIQVVGSNLLVMTDGGYDYYIPISTLQKAAK